MKESIFSKKRILLLGSGELGKELVISVSGSKGSKFKLINNINYNGLN